MEPPSKRSRRLNQMVVEKDNQGENVKRKTPFKVTKPKSDGKDAVVNPTNVLKPSMVNLEENAKKNIKKKTKVSCEPKKVTSKVLKPNKIVKKTEKKLLSGGENVAMDVALPSASKQVVVDEESVDDRNVKKKLVKQTVKPCKDDKKNETIVKPKVTAGKIKPKEAAVKTKPKKKSGKGEVKCTVHGTNEKQDENSTEQDENSTDRDDEYSASDVSESKEVAGKDAVEANDEKEEEFESASSKDEFSDEDSFDLINSRDAESKSAAANIETKEAPTNEKKDESPSSSDEMSTDEDSVEVANTSDAKPKRDAGNTNSKKAAKTEEKSTVKKENEMVLDSNHASPTNEKKDESSSSSDEMSTDEDSVEVANTSDAKPKRDAGNTNPKKAAKTEENSTVEKENEMVLDTNYASPSTSTQIDSNEQSNNGMCKIMSRIESKLDGLVCNQMNEKRMFAIILRMPFDDQKDINQYDSDLGDVDLYLKFAKYLQCVGGKGDGKIAKYLQCVGGKGDGKIVCNILHLIATPNLLSQFDWQISSGSKSFQSLKNVNKLIHTAAEKVCSDKYNMTVCGEVIKNVLRNARNGAYKK